MYSPEEIIKIVQEKNALTKNNEYKLESEKTNTPNYNAIYAIACELACKIAVHSQYGIFPEKLFCAKAPNQDPAEFAFQKSIYPQPPITMPYWMKAMGVLNRIWNDSNWSIKWGEDDPIYANDTAQTYFEKEYPNFGSYESFHKQVYLDRKIQDPNAVSVFKPLFIPTKQTPTDEGFVLEIDTDVLIEPIEIIYPCSQVVAFKENNYAIILLNEKNKLTDGSFGVVFEFYDEMAIWKLIQVGNKNDNKFDLQLYYQHNLDLLPARKLKGRPVFKDEYILYESYFLPAVSLLDEAVRNFSTKQMSTYANAFSVRWEYFDKCDNQGCEGGRIKSYGEDNAMSWSTCGICKGTGNKNKYSPTGVYGLRVPNRLEEGDQGIPAPPLGFVAPGTEILDYLSKDIKESIQNAFTILNLDISNSDVKGSDTALGKQIDRDEMFSFLLRISHEVFEAFEFGINVMGLMRYGFKNESESYFIPPTISYPRTFQIRSEDELTDELQKAKTAGVPDIALRELLQEWLYMRFNNMEDVSSIVELVFKVDRLVTKADVDINAGIAIGTIAKWEQILHTSIYTFIEESIVSDSEFLYKDFEAKKTALVDMAKAKALEISPLQNTAEDLLLGIANG